ncbi:helix-turn-helix domain-containing protein [Paenibacillus sp. strain BS8-2]
MLAKKSLKEYQRSLLTYLPIIFFIITVIASISFLVINDISSKQAIQANKVFTSYIEDMIDSRLLETERNVVMDISSNSVIQNYLLNSNASEKKALDYSFFEEIRKITIQNSIVKSIEFLWFEDKRVITSVGWENLSSFSDRDYAISRIDQPSSISWSSPRKLMDNMSGTDYWVISMTKRIPFPFGDQGLVLIHIDLSSLMSMIDPLINNFTFIQVWDSEQMLYPYSETAADQAGSAEESNVMTSMTSEYSGLTMKSGLKSAVLLSWMSVLSYVWVGVGMLLILVCILLLIYLSKRKYRPIEEIINQIDQYESRMSLDSSRSGNEFSFIQHAIEQFIHQTQTYEKEKKGDMVIRRQQLFRELVEGKRTVNRQVWEEELGQFQMRSSFAHITFVIIEIDHYQEFCTQYSVRDQSLFKFSIANVLIEMAGHHDCGIWGEWMNGHSFGVLVYNEDEDMQTHRDFVRELCEQLRAWVNKHLRFTLSAGIGQTATELDGVPKQFEDAQSALKYKLTLGADQIFDSAHLNHNVDNEAYNYLHMIREIIEDFRLNEQWKEQLKRMFGEWRSRPLPEDEIRNLVQYLLYLFSQSVETLPGDLPDYWEEQLLPDLNKNLDQAESLTQIEQAISDGLCEMYDAFQVQLGVRSWRPMIKEIRSYIELHYTDPNLSLKDISDRFDVNGKYVSQLFKEEFGEKFGDFLVNLRMEHAKHLLLSTGDPLKDIALEVGYTNPISFGRTFKKIVGIPPMDYRKMMSAE